MNAWSVVLLRFVAVLPIATGVFAVTPVARSAETPWVELYNGRDLTGWIQRGGQAGYRAEGDQIVGNSVPRSENSFLCTMRLYTNFVLELEFRVATNLNSGVQIRSECFETPVVVTNGTKVIRIPAGRVHGYQVEIDPSVRAWSGGIYDEGRRGWLADLRRKPEAQKAFRRNDWNRLRIEARGPSLKTWLNGVPAAEVTDSLTPAGFIALQVHGVGDRREPAEVRWRGLRLRELP